MVSSVVGKGAERSIPQAWGWVFACRGCCPGFQWPPPGRRNHHVVPPDRVGAGIYDTTAKIEDLDRLADGQP
jgi:hypothetical protein